MTYCVGMLLDAGLVFLSDSRTNAGVDQISTFRKMTVFEQPGERVMVLLTAGNLAISQAVVNLLREQEGGTTRLWSAKHVRSGAPCGRGTARDSSSRCRRAQGTRLEFNASLIFGGQIGGESPRLFCIYAAGNFIEATTDTPYFQIGESKYGKPILDRVLWRSTSLARGRSAR